MPSDRALKLDGTPYRRVKADPRAGGTRRASPARFRFVDVFAGIGGMRGGLMLAGGECTYSIEKDDFARQTYAANWGVLQGKEVELVAPGALGTYEVLAAGFPCQPFSLAGVVKKASLGRRHGFADPTSGNLFFEIIRLIGGPIEMTSGDLAREADPELADIEFVGEPNEGMPPVLLLENVRNLRSHDNGRTFQIIRRRLLRSGYRPQAMIVNAAHWVPQNRHRIFIVALRRDLFDFNFTFPPLPDALYGAPDRMFTRPASEVERYRLTPGVWAALQRHRASHEAKRQGFGYGIAKPGHPTRTLSARYYKDGAEILIPFPDGKEPPRRLTPEECADLMGHAGSHLLRPFAIPVSDSQAYKQFGNGVVMPLVAWIGNAIVAQCGSVFAKRMAEAAFEKDS
jgi:DNA (cytosine-5)-methyltransferase 1